MIIRKAKAEDIDAIQALDLESIDYHKRFDKKFYRVGEKNKKLKRKELISAIKKTKNFVFVAEDKKKVVGYVWGHFQTHKKKKYGTLQEISVTDNYRKKGIGTRLVRKLMNEFKKPIDYFFNSGTEQS